MCTCCVVAYNLDQNLEQLVNTDFLHLLSSSILKSSSKVGTKVSSDLVVMIRPGGLGDI